MLFELSQWLRLRGRAGAVRSWSSCRQLEMPEELQGVDTESQWCSGEKARVWSGLRSTNSGTCSLQRITKSDQVRSGVMDGLMIAMNKHRDLLIQSSNMLLKDRAAASAYRNFCKFI
ncbi:hypothetical protein DPEC_G00181400 [Dallia pectoralis]|uniref:Uncharacterized protein n=1 Tax=Dallia pectoralis TaxID=75939 RepID=A0ACC2GAJ3_DALPE|nr:hypothetical protein DPEC_G00181400 [Dallia pectoralis]